MALTRTAPGRHQVSAAAGSDAAAWRRSSFDSKPVRETLATDILLVVDHFRYFAAAARAEEGRSTEIEKDLVAHHFRAPLGVLGHIIPFNFPLLMAALKLASTGGGQLRCDQAGLAPRGRS